LDRPWLVSSTSSAGSGAIDFYWRRGECCGISHPTFPHSEFRRLHLAKRDEGRRSHNTHTLDGITGDGGRAEQEEPAAGRWKTGRCSPKVLKINLKTCYIPPIQAWNQLPRCQRNLIILGITAFCVTVLLCLSGDQLLAASLRDVDTKAVVSPYQMPLPNPHHHPGVDKDKDVAKDTAAAPGPEDKRPPRAEALSDKVYSPNT